MSEEIFPQEKVGLFKNDKSINKKQMGCTSDDNEAVRIIAKEEIGPKLNAESTPDWVDIEKSIKRKYPELSPEYTKELVMQTKLKYNTIVNARRQ